MTMRPGVMKISLLPLESGLMSMLMIPELVDVKNVLREGNKEGEVIQKERKTALNAPLGFTELTGVVSRNPRFTKEANLVVGGEECEKSPVPPHLRHLILRFPPPLLLPPRRLPQVKMR